MLYFKYVQKIILRWTFFKLRGTYPALSCVEIKIKSDITPDATWQNVGLFAEWHDRVVLMFKLQNLKIFSSLTFTLHYSFDPDVLHLITLRGLKLLYRFLLKIPDCIFKNIYLREINMKTCLLSKVFSAFWITTGTGERAPCVAKFKLTWLLLCLLMFPIFPFLFLFYPA